MIDSVPARSARAVAAAVLLAFASSACATTVAPRPDLSAPGDATTVDDGLYAAVLVRHVDDDGNVDYAALQAGPDDLERHYVRLARLSPHSHPAAFPSADARLAYWLNAYNALVLVSVARLYPLASVEDVGTPWYLFFLPDLAGFFYLREHVLGGERWSLHALENEIVRARFGDPRIHFALNCASASCPRLPRKPFEAASLDAELDAETRRFFAEPRNLNVDDAARVVRLSAILSWYEDDFVDALREQGVVEPTLLDYVIRYAPPATARALRGPAADYAVEFVPYDWRLNDRGLER